MQKIPAIFMALIMVFSLVFTACGGDSSAVTGDNSTQQNGSLEDTAPVSEAEETAAITEPTDPAAQETEATEPAETDPTEPEPTETEVTDSTPTQSSPTEPTPTEPKPTETQPDPNASAAKELVGTWFTRMDGTDSFNNSIIAGFGTYETSSGKVLDFSTYMVVDSYVIDETLTFSSDGLMTLTTNGASVNQALIAELEGGMRDMLAAAEMTDEEFQQEIGLSPDAFLQTLASSLSIIEQPMSCSYRVDGNYIIRGATANDPNEAMLPFTLNGNTLTVNGATFTRN